MKMRFKTLALALALSLAAPAAHVRGQGTPQGGQPTQSELELLEEEHIRTRAEQGQSHASGGRPELGAVILGNPTSAVKVLRVGLHFNVGATEFGTLHHPFVELANTDGDVKVIDRADGKEITVLAPGSRIRVEHDGVYYLVVQDDAYLGAYEGPIFFRPTSRTNFFEIHSIRRTFSGTRVPLYRGAIEINRGRITASQPLPRVNLVNIVEVEDYVPGVVANESIASFATDALKAQAVAARGYAVANIGNYVARGYPFDIVDSSASQVYRGVISEHPNAVRASHETHGLVASHGGRIIGALYSSSFGGHSEDSEWIFTASPPSAAVTPYLRGIYDGEEPAPDLSSPSGIDAFWRTMINPAMYDDCSRQTPRNSFSRWRIELPAETIRTRLTAAMRVSGTNTGTITDVEVTRRMAASQRIAIARITLTTGVYEVRGWDNLRAVLGRTASSTPRPCGGTTAANFTLNNPSSIDVVKNADGTVQRVVAYGGGWGHNLGMSQYGANGRAHAGQNFIEILKAYYTGVDVGSFPIDIGRDPGSGPPTLRQEFAAPNALGTLEIRSSALKGLRVHLNELHDLSFDEATLAAGVVSVDVSEYLLAGRNVIQYNPVGRSGQATVNVIVH
ncbi:MAG TPA: SpoIID/LytB domain-containing protein [Vicinamibacterales bacterium]|nr:SpoIID/LytB domain-containing protein [Vicinamibacterales bacterium]